MRSEYLGICALLPGLAEQINAGLYLTRRMTREECREAIEGPAGVMGFDIEPKLVNRLLNDLSSFAPWEGDANTSQLQQLSQRADQLPIMQHVLSRLWQRAVPSTDDRRLTLRLADYETVGELQGAFGAHAAEVMERLSQPARAIVRRVFRALVTGTTISDAVRRPRRFGDLTRIVATEPAIVMEVVNAFRAPDCNFLRPPLVDPIHDDTIIDISHESLIRQWPSLTGWLVEEARATSLWQRLASSQASFERGEGDLLAGLDLANILAWWEQETPNAFWSSALVRDHATISAYVEKSKRAEEERREREEAAVRNERRRLRMRGTVYAGLAILAMLSTGVALWSAEHASRETSRAEANLAAARAVVNDVTDLLYEEKIEAIPGSASLVRDVMTLFQPRLEDFIRQSSADGASLDLARARLRMAMAVQKIGGGTEVLDNFKTAFESALALVAKAPEDLHYAQKVTVLFGAGWQYIWSLYDFGRKSEAEIVITRIEELRPALRFDESKLDQVIAIARYYNALSRNFSDNKQWKESLTAQMESERLARIAVDLSAGSPGSPLALRLLGNSLTNQGLDLEALGEKQAAIEKRQAGCEIKARVADQFPFDSLAVAGHARCLKDAAFETENLNEKFRLLDLAQESLEFLLRVDPDVAVTRVGLLTILQNKHSHLIKDKALQRQVAWLFVEHWERLFAGRSIVPQYVNGLTNAFEQIVGTEFDDLGERERFYRRLFEAIRVSADSFPDVQAINLAAGLSALRLARLFEKDELRRPDAYPLIELSINYLDRSHFLDDTSEFSERFATVCESYGARAKLLYYDRKVDEYITNFKTIRQKCEPILDKYPFDFYLRQYFDSGYMNAGELLFNAERYEEARPYLEYGAKYGQGSSTKLLARMYDEGLGVKADKERAAELNKKAAGQSMKRFTIPTDFGSSGKFPFHFYVMDRPKDFPYKGIDDQVEWLKQARGGTVPEDVVKSFRTLQQIAWDKNVSFPELVASALGNMEEDKTKRVETFKSVVNEKDSAAIKKKVLRKL